MVCAAVPSAPPYASCDRCASCRLTLFRLERRFFKKTYSDALLMVDICNALGLDEVLHAIAPCSGFGTYVIDPTTRKAQVPWAHRCVRTIPRARLRHPALCDAQIYTADVNEYMSALYHVVDSVRPLALGWGKKASLPYFVQRAFRDVLAMVMCAPNKFRQGMRPTRSAHSTQVRDPADPYQRIYVTIKHKDQWWSNPPAEWERRIGDYVDPERIAIRAHRAAQRSPPSGADTDAAEDTADGSAQEEEATARVSHAASMRQRWEDARTAVRQPRRPGAASALASAHLACVAPCACTLPRAQPRPHPRGCVRSVTRPTSPASRPRTWRTGSRST